MEMFDMYREGDCRDENGTGPSKWWTSIQSCKQHQTRQGACI